MLCRDLMRRPVQTADPYESAQTAARRMEEANVGFAPVCDDHGALVGVITDRDLALRVCGPGRSSAEVQIGEILTPAVVTCRPEDELSTAEELMARAHVSRIVVTDDAGHVEGVISLSDVAMADSPGATSVLREIAARELLDAGGAAHGPSP